MQTPKPSVPLGILISVAVLALVSAFGAWLAWWQHSWVMALLALAAAVTSVAAARMLRWSRFPLYGLAALVTGFWLRSFYESIHVHYFAQVARKVLYLELLAGSGVILLALWCCYMAHRHFGAHGKWRQRDAQSAAAPAVPPTAP